MVEPRDSPPRQLVGEKYELVRLIAEAGMGTVYEARHTGTLKRCAIKMIAANRFSGDAEAVQRLMVEARAAALIESDHVVQVFDSGIDNPSGRPYLVMELLRGIDLRTALQQTGPLEPSAGARLILQAATGLARAHELRVLHRDIKPANLFLTMRDSGEICVKLLDFGIAKIQAPDASELNQALTQTRGILGTPLYMSPEQVRGAANVAPSSDVWSLGIVFFECLSGQFPFESTGSMGELMSAVLNDDLRSISELAPWVPKELAAVVDRALSRDLSYRYRDGGEFREALAQVVPEGPQLLERSLLGVNRPDRTQVSPVLLPTPRAPGSPASPLTPRTPAPQTPRMPAPQTPRTPAPQTPHTPAPHTPHTPLTARAVVSSMPVEGGRNQEPTWRSAVDSGGEPAASPSRKKERTRLALSTLGAGALLASLVIGAAVLLNRSDLPREPATVLSMQSHAASAQPAGVAPPGPAIQPSLAPSFERATGTSMSNAPAKPSERRFDLQVPMRAEVEIDGRPAPVTNGQVTIAGEVGKTVVVRLRQSGQSMETRVLITEHGLSPSRLSAWNPERAAGSKTNPPGREQRTAPKATASAAPSAPAAKGSFEPGLVPWED